MKRRLGKRWLGGTGIAAAAATTLFFWSFPVFAAFACPACFDLEREGRMLYVDRKMTLPQRVALRDNLLAAHSRVAGFYQGFAHQPVLLVCGDEACDRALGGRGARATTYSTPFLTVIRVSPRGTHTVILAHELAHVEQHGRAGVLKLFTGRFPAWFDEGLAVIVSEDGRYLADGTTAKERCRVSAREDLPVSPGDWSRLSGRDHSIYASAACRVLQWLERNGGKPGLFKALASGGITPAAADAP